MPADLPETSTSCTWPGQQRDTVLANVRQVASLQPDNHDGFVFDSRGHPPTWFATWTRTRVYARR